MSIETIDFEGNKYPKFQLNGNAARFCREYAMEVCKGFRGLDIGCSKEDWKFQGAPGFPQPQGIDLSYNDGYHASNLPEGEFDYIHASHIGEHLLDWVSVFDYWQTKLKSGGVLFLYLPDYSQRYHRPWVNKKHKNIFSPQIIKDYLEHRQYKNIFVSGVDLYNGFMAMAEKQ